jgi:hypothetical protein
MMIREFLQRRAIRRAFSRYISPEALDALLSGQLPDPDALPLRTGEIGYVLAWLRGDSAEQISERMGRTAEIAVQYGGITDCMVSGLIVVCFGALQLADSQPRDRSGLVAALIQEYGEDIKLVHGTSWGHYGNLGGSKRLAYSFVLPEFERALARLCALQFGQTEEYSALQRGA